MVIVIAEPHEDPLELVGRRDRLTCDAFTQMVTSDQLTGMVVLHPALRTLKVSHAREDYERVRVISDTSLLVGVMRCVAGGLVEWVQPTWLPPDPPGGSRP